MILAPAASLDAAIDAAFAVLHSDAGVRTMFGDPPRVFDDDSLQPAYPYIELASAETRELESERYPGGAHYITLATYGRHGGRIEVARGVGIIRAAIDAASITLPDGREALAHVLYTDALRTSNALTYRGLVRIRLIPVS